MRTRRLPAEWEPQDGILLSWPHEQTDWAGKLDRIEGFFIELVKQIVRFEPVCVICPEPFQVRQKLARAGVDIASVEVIQVPTNDVWIRDFGPIAVYEDGEPLLLDFDFNGWGLKYPYQLDNAVNRRLQETEVFAGKRWEPVGLVLEGGSMDTDGQGTLLVTRQCLLSASRNPHLHALELERVLKNHLGARKVVWLSHGSLAGDDTDGHIDLLARFCPERVLVHVLCDDVRDDHFEELAAMKEELASVKNAKGERFHLVPLPMPRPKFDSEGRRLPASYANFVIINQAVLVPTYRDPADSVALSTLADLFPDREVIGIDCLEPIGQGGALHCVTMPLPLGSWR